MTEAEHTEMVEQERRGKIRVGVDRTVARQFFTNVPVSAVKAATGYSPYIERAVVLFAMLAGPLALIASVGESVFAFGLWGAVAIVLCPPLWIANHAASSRGGARLYPFGATLVVLVLMYLLGAFTIQVFLFLELFVLSLFCSRLLYVAATSFYRAMVLRSAKLYDFLAAGIVIRGCE